MAIRWKKGEKANIEKRIENINKRILSSANYKKKQSGKTPVYELLNDDEIFNAKNRKDITPYMKILTTVEKELEKNKGRITYTTHGKNTMSNIQESMIREKTKIFNRKEKAYNKRIMDLDVKLKGVKTGFTIESENVRKGDYAKLEPEKVLNFSNDFLKKTILPMLNRRLDNTYHAKREEQVKQNLIESLSNLPSSDNVALEKVIEHLKNLDAKTIVDNMRADPYAIFETRYDIESEIGDKQQARLYEFGMAHGIGSAKTKKAKRELLEFKRMCGV